jgi:hypothetical protein
VCWMPCPIDAAPVAPISLPNKTSSLRGRGLANHVGRPGQQ